MKPIVVAGLAAAALAAPAGASGASSSGAPQIVGTPSVRYLPVEHGGQRSMSLGAVVRLDRAIDRRDTSLVTGPSVRSGQQAGRLFGGDAPGRIGRRDRHCYAVELRRPFPAPRPTQGARWRLAVMQSGTFGDTASVTLKRWSGGGGWERQAVKRLGC